MKIYLKKNEERRLKNGHQWIFSNEIEIIEGFKENGQLAELYSSFGNYLGQGFYNKNSLIAYRHLTSNREEINKQFISKKLLIASSLRTELSKKRNVYRLVNSESDFLPGLIIDKFDDKYSLQIFSIGMEKFKNEIVELLVSDFGASLIIEKNNNELRLLEGLQKLEGILFDKENMGDRDFEVEIYGIKYKIDLLNGQKTGFYLDQIENHKLIRNYIKDDSTVLDLFCNVGGFSLNAAMAGAKRITAVDSSAVSIENAKINSGKNNFNNIEFICYDVFDFITKNQNRKYDFIILDPPSFTKSKKNLETAAKGYIELNSEAMKMLNRNSFLFTFSCSHYIYEKIFENILSKSSALAKKNIQIIEFRNCSVDHPVIPQMNETKYLKSYLLKIL